MNQERPERGAKRICLDCGTRFYDLMRVPPICPKCGAECGAVARPLRSSRAKPKGRSAAKARPAQTWEAEEARHHEENLRPADDDRDAEAEDDADEGNDLQTEDEE